MTMRQTQQQTTRQKMSLTQQMRSSLSLLQMGADEIAREINDEAKRNPFLKPLPPGPPTGGGAPEHGTSDLVQHSTQAEELLHQVALVRLASAEARLAQELVYCLDERGFFSDSLQEMSGYLGASPTEILAVAEKLQNAVEPAGIFVWSLAQSFAVQLKSKNLFDPLIARLLERLDLIAVQDLDAICDHCEVDREDAEDMLNDIRSLNPSPLSPPVEIDCTQRAPDLIIRRNDAAELSVELNANALPKMLSDDALFSTVRTAETDDQALAYYRDCYRSAGAFVVAMQKRANTLLKIGQVMADTQDKFFRTGRPLDRRPLTMGGMAAELGLHKSTVSRAMNNCLIDSDHGVIPASDLIVRPLSDATDQKTREQALKRLTLLIKTENKRSPLSDQALSEQLDQLNLGISRRTVAKYRGLLGIPKATDRRA
jgi:RNA polymerase sigma-54 factor